MHLITHGRTHVIKRNQAHDARMRVGRASCGYLVGRGLRGTGTSVPLGYLGVRGFAGFPPAVHTCARLPHLPMAERAPFALKKYHPCVSLVELGVGLIASRPASALVSGIAAELPSESPVRI